MRKETAASVRANVASCMAGVIDAAAAHHSAVEHHRAVAASVKQLSEHESERSAACGNAETEFEARTSVLSGLELECAHMVSARRQAAEELRMSTAALDTHTKDAARRARAHEVEIRRAEDRFNAATTLRELSTRESVMGEDRAALEAAVQRANATAEAASDALTAARDRRDVAQQADATITARLSAETEKARTTLGKREHIAASVQDRVKASRALHSDAQKALACATLALHTVRGELQTQQARLEGSLQVEVCRSSEALRVAERALVAAQGEESETPQRHAEDAEALLLQHQQDIEATLVAAVNEARISAAEAHEDASLSGAPQEFDLLLTSAIGHFDDRQSLAHETAQAFQEAIEAVDRARKELDESKQDSERQRACSSSFSGRTSSPGTQLSHAVSEAVHQSLLCASAEATVSYLEHVADERRASQAAAQAAVQAAAEELQALEEQHKAKPKTNTPIALVVDGEIETVDALIQAHNDAERSVLEEAKVASAEWALKRQELHVSLHTASLQVAHAEDSVQATKELRKIVTNAS